MEDLFVRSSDLSPSRLSNVSEKPTDIPYIDWQRKQLERIQLAISNSPVDHSKLFGEKSEHTDTTINVHGKTIYAHRAVLETRCPLLLITAIKKKTFKKASVSLELDDKKIMSFKAFHILLKYLYSANIHLFGKDLLEIVDLIHTAKLYEVHLLSEICEQFLYVSLTDGNWFRVLKYSDKLGLEDAKMVCMMWAKRYFDQLISQRAGMSALGFDLFYDVVNYYVLTDKEKLLRPVEDIAKSAVEAIRSDFKKLYQEMPYADTSFVVGEETIVCHKSFLSPFPELMKYAKGKQQKFSDVTEKYEFDSTIFKNILQFLYYTDEDEIDPFISRHLLSFATDFGLLRLRDACERKIRTGITILTVPHLLQMARGLENGTKRQKEIAAEVEANCLSFVVENFTKLDFTTFNDPNLIADILDCLKLNLQQKKCKYHEQMPSRPSPTPPHNSHSTGILPPASHSVETLQLHQIDIVRPTIRQSLSFSSAHAKKKPKKSKRSESQKNDKDTTETKKRTKFSDELVGEDVGPGLSVSDIRHEIQVHSYPAMSHTHESVLFPSPANNRKRSVKKSYRSEERMSTKEDPSEKPTSSQNTPRSHNLDSSEKPKYPSNPTNKHRSSRKHPLRHPSKEKDNTKEKQLKFT
eukprot:TRINITY_DN6201_c0_g1_i1.p1 TRINITY_DN6201_c0_g1~~TRINITY_DN6201_c0_g1_i1.p1  ORF type:complete len:636 (+),score=166.23 TRINITY_DN6201_c0_g1_i1:125-2032(+)